jgi:hypothetical protein
MAITATCSCGKVYTGKDEWAGRRMTCSACKRAIIMPEADDPAAMTSRTPAPGRPEVTDVRLVGVAIPFMDMVALLFQIGFASLLAGTVIGVPLGLLYFFLANRP